jgi:hypothetical protein
MIFLSPRGLARSWEGAIRYQPVGWIVPAEELNHVR